MFVPWISKTILGFSILIGTGVGISGITLTSKRSDHINTETNKTSEIQEEDKKEDFPKIKEDETISTKQEEVEGKSENLSEGKSEETKDLSNDEPVSVPEKRCSIYQINSSSTGRVTPITESQLEKELGENSQNYQTIKRVCDDAKEKDIFLSKKDGISWKYYPEEQNHRSVKNYVKKYFSVSK